MKYTVHKTHDESLTLFNHARQEHYHSHDGAFQEAQLKYFEACQLKRFYQNRNLNLFEVGFGLGYNLIPILKHIDLFKFKIVYTSTESDMDLFSYLIKNIDLNIPDEFKSIFNEIYTHKYYEDEKLEVIIHCGDVRKSIQEINSNSIDAIFHDPFSPYKNTECWTLDFFKEEYRIMKKDAILSTYSMSTPVRSGLYQAGFKVWEGVGDKTKTTGTIATKTSLPGLFKLSDKMLSKFHNSPERIPFMDPKLNLDHEKIKEQRLNKKAALDYSDIIRKDLKFYL